MCWGPIPACQFHPEVTAEIVGQWIDEARATSRMGASEAQEILSGFDHQGQGPEDQIRTLFDGFVARAGVAP